MCFTLIYVAIEIFSENTILGNSWNSSVKSSLFICWLRELWLETTVTSNPKFTVPATVCTGVLRSIFRGGDFFVDEYGYSSTRSVVQNSVFKQSVIVFHIMKFDSFGSTVFWILRISYSTFDMKVSSSYFLWGIPWRFHCVIFLKLLMSSFFHSPAFYFSWLEGWAHFLSRSTVSMDLLGGIRLFVFAWLFDFKIIKWLSAFL